MTDQPNSCGPACSEGHVYHGGCNLSVTALAEALRKVESSGPRPGCSPAAAETEPNDCRLAQSGVSTPGCDCGHDCMGRSWHASDCAWRAGGRPLPTDHLRMSTGTRVPTVDRLIAGIADDAVGRLTAGEVERLRAAAGACGEAEAAVARAWAFAAEMRNYCSPHGVSALYADRLEAALRGTATPEAGRG